MSKLFSLKQYLTVEESVKHLSNFIKESVSLADLYRLVLDGHLTMSVRFSNQAYAKAGEYALSQGAHNESLIFEKLVHVIDGVWDLAMIGTESQEIELLYQAEVDGPGPTYPEVNGFCLKREGIIYKLQKDLHLKADQDHLNAIEARLGCLLKSKGLTIDELYESDNSLAFERFNDKELDEFMSINAALMQDGNDEHIEGGEYLALDDADYQFVIRTNELTRFVRALQDEPASKAAAEKPLGTRERNTLLKIIGSLLNELNIDPSQRGMTTAVQAMVELKGMPINEVTIRKILREVALVIENR